MADEQITSFITKQVITLQQITFVGTYIYIHVDFV